MYPILDKMQREMDPPYSDGVYFIEFMQGWTNKDLWFSVVPIMADPLFSRLIKYDGLYVNSDCTKFSICHIVREDAKGEKEEFLTYSQIIESKFPGFKLDDDNIVMNVDGKNVDGEQLI